MYNPLTQPYPYNQISHKDLWEISGRTYTIDGVFHSCGLSEPFVINISPQDSVELIMAILKAKLVCLGDVEIIHTNLPPPIDLFIKDLKLMDPVVIQGLKLLQAGLKPNVIAAYYAGFGNIDFTHMLNSCFGRATNKYSFIYILLEDYRDIRDPVTRIAKDKASLEVLSNQFDIDFKLINGWVFKSLPSSQLKGIS